MAEKTQLDTGMYQHCRLCPRSCGIDRTSGEPNYCGETATCRVSSAEPHFGEEPSFSGTRGSGTIFFTGCSSCCFFCQNYQISQEGLGQEFTPDELVDTALLLVKKGVHNINFVTPDHFWPHVSYVCRRLREQGVTIPFVFNCSGYEREDLIEEYAELIDIFMPDFKFAQPDLAQSCMGDCRYPEIALAALKKMVELKGFLRPWDPTGRATAAAGVLVRHLVLPGHTDSSLESLLLLHHEFGSGLPISVMSQFRPMPGCEQQGDMTRRVLPEEFEAVCDLVESLGFRHAYVQPSPSESNDDFVPDFERAHPFQGNVRAPS